MFRFTKIAALLFIFALVALNVWAQPLNGVYGGAARDDTGGNNAVHQLARFTFSNGTLMAFSEVLFLPWLPLRDPYLLAKDRYPTSPSIRL